MIRGGNRIVMRSGFAFFCFSFFPSILQKYASTSFLRNLENSDKNCSPRVLSQGLSEKREFPSLCQLHFIENVREMILRGKILRTVPKKFKSFHPVDL